jgi:hypothetical protein
MYSVKLNDGTIINAELNGNNFIPDVLDKNVFIGNLDIVTITDNDGNEEVLLNQKVQFAKIGDKDTFILLCKTKEEELLELLADLTEVVLLGGM